MVERKLRTEGSAEEIAEMDSASTIDTLDNIMSTASSEEKTAIDKVGIN